MISGLAVTLGYILISKATGWTLFGIINIGVGIFGVIVNALVVYFVSKATSAPSQEIQDDVTDYRYPEQMTYKNGEAFSN